MKKLISLLVVIAVAGVWLPAMAQQVYDQSVYLLQSRDAGDPSDEQVALCNEKALEVSIPGIVVQILTLNAEWWTFQTRSKDGMIKNEFIRQVGTADACAFFVLTDPGPPPVVRMVMYADSDGIGIKSEGWGECDLPILGMPTPNSQTGTCNVIINPDPSQGIAGGIATSNSVFGEDTGSIWTFRVFWE
jgi:hypothetical protein